MLNVYADFLSQELAIPTIKGQKTDKEKFAGAEATYTVEALMHDERALQSGTSHYFGSKFAEAYDIKVAGRDNKEQYVYQTSPVSSPCWWVPCTTLLTRSSLPTPAIWAPTAMRPTRWSSR